MIKKLFRVWVAVMVLSFSVSVAIGYLYNPLGIGAVEPHNKTLSNDAS